MFLYLRILHLCTILLAICRHVTAENANDTTVEIIVDMACKGLPDRVKPTLRKIICSRYVTNPTDRKAADHLQAEINKANASLQSNSSNQIDQKSKVEVEWIAHCAIMWQVSQKGQGDQKVKELHEQNKSFAQQFGVDVDKIENAVKEIKDFIQGSNLLEHKSSNQDKEIVEELYLIQNSCIAFVKFLN